MGTPRSTLRSCSTCSRHSDAEDAAAAGASTLSTIPDGTSRRIRGEITRTLQTLPGRPARRTWTTLAWFHETLPRRISGARTTSLRGRAAARERVRRPPVGVREHDSSARSAGAAPRRKTRPLDRRQLEASDPHSSSQGSLAPPRPRARSPPAWARSGSRSRRWVPRVALPHRRPRTARRARRPAPRRGAVLRVGRLDRRRPLLPQGARPPAATAGRRDHAGRLRRPRPRAHRGVPGRRPDEPPLPRWIEPASAHCARCVLAGLLPRTRRRTVRARALMRSVAAATSTAALAPAGSARSRRKARADGFEPKRDNWIRGRRCRSSS